MKEYLNSNDTVNIEVMNSNMNPPLISILTDTKNRAGLISRCIESIQRQTYQNYEHIIADGGTDNTEEVVRSYNDPRIKYIRVPEGGPIAQTRKAFEMSCGAFITFLDDDDEYLPEKIEKQLELIQSLPEEYGFIYGSMTYYDNDTRRELRTHKAELEGGAELLPIAVANPVICGTPTLMFRREVFQSIGGTWISGIGNERSDWALVCKALKQGWKVGALKESYLRIYVGHGAVRMSDPHFYKDNADRYIKFAKYFLTEYADVIEKNPRSGITHYRSLIVQYMVKRDYGHALGAWKKLLRVDFSLHNLCMFPYHMIKSVFKR